MGRRKYDAEIRIRLTQELKEVVTTTASKLEVTETDVMRMLIRTLKDKGLSLLQ